MERGLHGTTLKETNDKSEPVQGVLPESPEHWTLIGQATAAAATCVSHVQGSGCCFGGVGGPCSSVQTRSQHGLVSCAITVAEVLFATAVP